MYYRHTAKCAEEEGAIGRQTERKALIAMAVEERGAGLGRIRMQRVRNASVAGLLSFVKGRREQASELLPLVHKAISLLKRWLLGTHQGGVSHEHPDYYLDGLLSGRVRVSVQPAQLTQPWKLFYRLVQQAVAVEPTP